MEPVYQCCYTNATQNVGNQAASGWQVTASSPGIPSNAYEACVKLQDANSSLCADAVDEQGNVLVLNEYCGDGSYLYVIRTQFGLSDRLGRPNMFSHALIFPLRGSAELFRDPNYCLALHSASFSSGEGELPREGSPSYLLPFPDLKGAMLLAGLGEDRERYATLIRCVYAQLDAKGASPLYVQYDGPLPRPCDSLPLRIRGLLHCIYAGLPRHVLRTLRVATCPTANDAGKHLVFTRSVQGRERYLIPQSGENTVLTPRLERKLSRYGYVDHAVLHLPQEEFPGFFNQLDNLAVNFGDPSASNSQILKLAFQFLSNPHESTFTDAELESSFADALRLPPSVSHTVELLLTRMLKEVNKRGLRLAPESGALLDGWLARTSSQELLEAGRRYQRN